MLKIFVDNKIEETFVESNTAFSMELTDRDKSMLVLDKSVCWSRIMFDYAKKCNE